jgi:Uma2 family endonuclease
MDTLLEPPEAPTLEDLQEDLGGVPARRILLRPSPGTATEEDVIRLLHSPSKRACELIDGTLVEKPMGWTESMVGSNVLSAIHSFLKSHPLGVVTGEQGTIKLWLGRVRIPDVAFFRKERFPTGKLPKERIPLLTPDLSVEVLSESNTVREMSLKRADYFQAGTQLVWEIDPEARSVEVFTAPNESKVVEAEGILEGSDVLPGFTLTLRDVFANLDQIG